MNKLKFRFETQIPKVITLKAVCVTWFRAFLYQLTLPENKVYIYNLSQGYMNHQPFLFFIIYQVVHSISFKF